MKAVFETPADFKVQRSAAVLRHSVTESIRNAICLGHSRPGARLPERELCEMAGVSRTLVREALRQLESEGLIPVIPHRGPVVERLLPEQAAGVYQVREDLEGLACQLFAEHASDPQLHALQEAFQTLQCTLSQGTPLERLTAKNFFYQRLLEGAGNEALTSTLRMLNSRIMLLRTTSMQTPGRIRESLTELADLMECLAARDGAGARAAARRHVRNAARVAIENLRHEQAGAGPSGA